MKLSALFLASAALAFVAPATLAAQPATAPHDTVDPTLPTHGELVIVDYGSEGLSSLFSSGLGHGVYTRLDAMLFHASLVTSRLYPPRT